MKTIDPIQTVNALGFPWRTRDPFLFCVHHDDAYPAGNEKMGPARSLLAGRNIGQDFEGKDGWRMYHGEVVPGFPQHPHRGFETVTVTRRGFIDHSDSLGAGARYGKGDVQWLTAGKGINHAEMFPLIDAKSPNPVELFQIWLNLPKAKKLVEPGFAMFWSEKVPRVSVTDAAGRKSEITVIAGRFGEAAPLAPPPDSWASDPRSDVAIWTLKLAPNAELTLPATDARNHRSLYFFRGSRLGVGSSKIPVGHQIDVHPDVPLVLENGDAEAEILVLQGRPIDEPIAQYGPFVMNTRAEIQQAFEDYQRTRFGGWKWGEAGPVHERGEGRFARYPDGRMEKPKIG